MMESDRQICIERLKRRLGEVEDILAIIKDNENLSNDDIIKAQERFKYVKRRLENDHNAGLTKRGQNAMTEMEREYYYPAIKESLEEIKVKINSIPDQQWVNELMAAQGHISFYLSQVESL